MDIKPNDADKNLWLQAQTLNQKLKENAQTHEADGRQAFFLSYTTQLEAISKH